MMTQLTHNPTSTESVDDQNHNLSLHPTSNLSRIHPSSPGLSLPSKLSPDESTESLMLLGYRLSDLPDSMKNLTRHQWDMLERYCLTEPSGVGSELWSFQQLIQTDIRLAKLKARLHKLRENHSDIININTPLDFIYHTFRFFRNNFVHADDIDFYYGHQYYLSDRDDTIIRADDIPSKYIVEHSYRKVGLSMMNWLVHLPHFLSCSEKLSSLLVKARYSNWADNIDDIPDEYSGSSFDNTVSITRIFYAELVSNCINRDYDNKNEVCTMGDSFGEDSSISEGLDDGGVVGSDNINSSSRCSTSSRGSGNTDNKRNCDNIDSRDSGNTNWEGWDNHSGNWEGWDSGNWEGWDNGNWVHWEGWDSGNWEGGDNHSGDRPREGEDDNTRKDEANNGDNSKSPGRDGGGSDNSPGRDGGGSDKSPGRDGGGSDDSPGRDGGGSDDSPGRDGGGSDKSPGRDGGGSDKSPGGDDGGGSDTEEPDIDPETIRTELKTLYPIKFPSLDTGMVQPFAILVPSVLDLCDNKESGNRCWYYLCSRLSHYEELASSDTYKNELMMNILNGDAANSKYINVKYERHWNRFKSICLKQHWDEKKGQQWSYDTDPNYRGSCSLKQLLRFIYNIGIKHGNWEYTAILAQAMGVNASDITKEDYNRLFQRFIEGFLPDLLPGLEEIWVKEMEELRLEFISKKGTNPKRRKILKEEGYYKKYKTFV